MSIHVQDITKKYGDQLAVDHISFEVNTGEIVGFIGPNGAGKSTTMKMITGTLPPSKGKIHIQGIDVLEHQKKIKNIIGYLPEHNPLYLDMYIREYLNYVGSLYRTTGINPATRIDPIIELTGLGDEAHKKIGSLSKGYRQRVGLAQALIHDPEILILDEPTSGLDPNQVIEIRNLISTVGKEKTILLSTHIMQEVEAICDRVIIINKGKIVADDKAESLINPSDVNKQTLLIEIEGGIDEQQWLALSFIDHVKILEGNQFLLEASDSSDIRRDIFNFAVSQGLTILSLSQKKKSLEEVFHEITGR